MLWTHTWKMSPQNTRKYLRTERTRSSMITNICKKILKHAILEAQFPHTNIPPSLSLLKLKPCVLNKSHTWVNWYNASSIALQNKLYSQQRSICVYVFVKHMTWEQIILQFCHANVTKWYEQQTWNSYDIMFISLMDSKRNKLDVRRGCGRLFWLKTINKHSVN